MVDKAAKNVNRGAMRTALSWTEAGLLPDTVIRAGIRRLNKQRLEDIRAHDIEHSSAQLNAFVQSMDQSPLAPLPQLANEQHYEVPVEFFAMVLGNHGKYSCCYWDEETQDLDEAEANALAISCERAGISDGMEVLDLGCGWGSLSLWIAEHYPGCRITSVSNSAPQRRWIEERARERGLKNLHVITCDMNEFDIDQVFDRVVSVEMFEHMRNYGLLFQGISRWLKPDGQFFMHIFCHRSCAYAFEDKGPSDWMGRHFFSGGIMPSADLPLRFQQDLALVSRHSWSGKHYEQTANAWLENMDSRRGEIMPLLAETYGEENATQWFQRWRIFFMACAELFGQFEGREWFVSHYLFERQSLEAS